uniref:ATP synthase complex subunit 8 n=1 Tax=Hyperoncus lateritius TaxID=2080394 RepID=A0A2P1CLT4_9HEMI|nr:ATP synthase F0 subunit 8 [Hyperoncus lateritius]
MPQMAPLYWELLFMMFILSLIMMSIIIYHLPKIPTLQKTEKSSQTEDINWKW